MNQSFSSAIKNRLASSLSRVEVFAQAVAEEVEGEHGERNGEARREHGVGGAHERREVARLVEHHAPRGRGRRHAQTQKRERRLRQNSARHAEARLHDERLHCVRSEEHTSELQSHSDLVCRLLLEKKKKKNTQQ